MSQLIKLLSFFLILLISTQVFASHKRPLKNLQDISYPDKAAISALINQLYLNANQTDAYQLSLPLIAYAQQGDRVNYEMALSKMDAALDKLPADAFKSWMLGRALLAAYSMDDRINAIRLHHELKPLLLNLANSAKDPHSLDYSFYSWSLGYITTVSKKEYKKLKSPMLKTAENLSTEYFATRTHDAASNAGWSWVLALQAAAKAHDKETYYYIVNQIKMLAEKPSMPEALNFIFNRSETSSDYPAWGFGIVHLAAVRSKDHVLAKELALPLKNSIDDAKKWSAQPNQSSDNKWKGEAEFTLARLNELLADYTKR